MNTAFSSREKWCDKVACPNSFSLILFGEEALKMEFIHKETQEQHNLLDQA